MRRIERPGDFETDRDAAARQCQNDRPGPSKAPFAQRLGDKIIARAEAATAAATREPARPPLLVLLPRQKTHCRSTRGDLPCA